MAPVTIIPCDPLGNEVLPVPNSGPAGLVVLSPQRGRLPSRGIERVPETYSNNWLC